MRGYPLHTNTAPAAADTDEERLTRAHELIGKEAPGMALTNLFGANKGKRSTEAGVLALRLASRFSTEDWAIVRDWLAKEVAP